MAPKFNRRSFLKTSSLFGAATTLGVWSEVPAAESNSPNEKLNIGAIGVANRAAANIAGVKNENIVAICDVDDTLLNRAARDFSKASKYNDFRRLIDKEARNIDAVVVGAPDHIHAPASAAAMQLGKHCYCEKPLTHTVYEARVLAELAAKNKLATQMGTQIHAGNNYRRVVEILQSGAIGTVEEVHTWVGASWGGYTRPTKAQPVPSNFHWDLWLGPAPKRPYHSTYQPMNWRGWWDFGGGALGDMACHHMDLPFWALGLRHPTTIEAHGPEVDREVCPVGLTVKYEYPARGSQPPVSLTWYDGNKIPSEVAGHKIPSAGSMFIGSKGQLYANYGQYKLYPEQDFADYKPPTPTIPNSIGHHQEWIKACKEGTPTTCNFDYSGALTEAVLLGNVSYRSGSKLDWDAKSLKATNCPAADEFLSRQYRSGWTL